jgi:hypothetical protein
MAKRKLSEMEKFIARRNMVYTMRQALINHENIVESDKEFNKLVYK